MVVVVKQAKRTRAYNWTNLLNKTQRTPVPSRPQPPLCKRTPPSRVTDSDGVAPSLLEQGGRVLAPNPSH